jgi:hypothetical protein
MALDYSIFRCCLFGVPRRQFRTFGDRRLTLPLIETTQTDEAGARYHHAPASEPATRIKQVQATSAIEVLWGRNRGLPHSVRNFTAVQLLELRDLFPPIHGSGDPAQGLDCM